MARKSNLSRDRVDADRIGRMSGRRVNERSVNGELAKRLAGFKNRSRARSGPANNTRQRVVVKALVSRHKPGKARGSIARHASYLGRESASADGQPGVFYDAQRQSVNARQEVTTWAEDRHHFRLIISPEHGGDIPDITAYVREVMRRVQRDLHVGMLEWIAVNHHNTDNPHAHVMIRGRREDGSDLVIPRQYISYGIRDRASEVATELLGPRSAQEVRMAKAKEVEAERFTSLDRMIERHATGGQVDVSPSRHIGFGPEDQRLVVARLQFLQQLELAHKGRGTQWQVEANFKQAMRDLGARNDIIKQLYASMGTEAGRVQRMSTDRVGRAPVSGVVIALGSVDEIGTDRYVVVRDAAGRPHYGRIRDGDAFRELAVGSLAELGGGAHFRQRVTDQILSVTRMSGGIYNPEQHQAYLRSSDTVITEREAKVLVRSAMSRLQFVSDTEGTGVQRRDDGSYAVDAVAFERFSQRKGQRMDVRVIASHPLAQQVQASAATWLDRQAFGDAPDARVRDHPSVLQAARDRQAWLVQNGYAQQAALDGVVLLRRDALRELARAEKSAAHRRLSERYDRPIRELPVGDTVSGTYRGTERLHGGRLAVVVDDNRVTVVPVRSEPDVARGSAVRVERTAWRTARIEGTTGQTLGRQAGADITQLEAGR